MKNLTDFKPHHIVASRSDLDGNGGFGRYILLPGSDGRAELLSKQFDDVRVLESPRRHNLYLGSILHKGRRIDVASVASGMGCPSLDIIANELIALGARRILRVGTAGAVHPRIRVGDIVVGTGAVRDEHTSRMYVPAEVPALAGLPWVLAARKTLMGSDDRVHFGIVHSKDSLFAREFHWGPQGEENREYMEMLAQSGALASEMESAHLFVLGGVWTAQLTLEEDRPENRVETGSILSIIGDDAAFAPADVAREAVDRTIAFSFQTIMNLAEMER